MELFINAIRYNDFAVAKSVYQNPKGFAYIQEHKLK